MHTLALIVSVVQFLNSLRGMVYSAIFILYFASIYVGWKSDIVILDAWSFVILVSGVAVSLYSIMNNCRDWMYYLINRMLVIVFFLIRVSAKIVVFCLMMILSAIYAVFPIDFIPDFLLGLGWIDDGLVIAGLMSAGINANIKVPDIDLSPEHVARHRVHAVLAAGIALLSVCALRFW